MEYPTKTRRCHHCHRHSWPVAEGNPCPWCGRRTGKYSVGFPWVVALVSIASTVSALWIIWSLAS
jgi:hypothetical protein